MFFPVLTRRDSYKKKRNGEDYLSYSIFKDEVFEDCQERCIYCDATLKEIGGEGLVLDHFRPTKHFIDLVYDPYNLVSACSFCNRYKSSHWPSTTDESHDGDVGFVDPFFEHKKSHFVVNDQGELEGATEPALYEIALLRLNRKSRIQLRRKRILVSEVKQFVEDIDPTKIDQAEIGTILNAVTALLDD